MFFGIQGTLVESGTKISLQIHDVDYIIEQSTGESKVLMLDSTDKYLITESVAALVANGASIVLVTDADTATILGIPGTSFSTVREGTPGATITLHGGAVIDTTETYEEIIDSAGGFGGIYSGSGWVRGVTVADGDPAGDENLWAKLQFQNLYGINLVTQRGDGTKANLTLTNDPSKNDVGFRLDFQDNISAYVVGDDNGLQIGPAPNVDGKYILPNFRPNHATYNMGFTLDQADPAQMSNYGVPFGNLNLQVPNAAEFDFAVLNNVWARIPFNRFATMLFFDFDGQDFTYTNPIPCNFSTTGFIDLAFDTNNTDIAFGIFLDDDLIAHTYNVDQILSQDRRVRTIINTQIMIIPGQKISFRINVSANGDATVQRAQISLQPSFDQSLIALFESGYFSISDVGIVLEVNDNRFYDMIAQEPVGLQYIPSYRDVGGVFDANSFEEDFINYSGSTYTALTGGDADHPTAAYTQATFFIVVQIDDLVNAGILFEHRGQSNQGDTFFSISVSKSAENIGLSTGDEAGNISGSFAQIDDLGVNVIAVSHDKVTGARILYINSVEKVNNTGPTNAVTTFHNLKIGAKALDIPTDHWTGKIGHFYQFNKIMAAEDIIRFSGALKAIY